MTPASQTREGNQSFHLHSKTQSWSLLLRRISIRQPPPQSLEQETIANASFSTQHSVPPSHSTSTNQYYPASVTTQYCPVLSLLLCPHPTCSFYIICPPLSLGGHVWALLWSLSLAFTPTKPFFFYHSYSFILVYWCDAHALHCMRRTWCRCYCTWLKMHRFVSLTLEIFHFWAGQVGRAGGYSPRHADA